MAEQIRPPIIVILGHIDHGKSTLLDKIRNTNLVTKEYGGITQHIGAYQVTHNSSPVTFIDTPGHAAFEKMRSRGAKVADIAVLVVAADDGVMAQTIEAIKHIQEAKVPMIVAVNKVDLLGGKGDVMSLPATLEKIKKQLSDQKVLIEEYGGDVPIVPISAKTGEGVDKLLEMILLVSELNELKGDPANIASGVVIEASLDKFKGPVATILIRNGTLKKGDSIVLDGVKSKVRGMFDYSGKGVEMAGPSTPVEVLGLETVPAVGATLGQESPGQTIKEAAASLVDRLKTEKDKTLKVIIKTDKQGSLEAIQASLEKFNEERKVIEFILSGTGDIGEENIKLAATVGAIVIGFNIKVAPTAQRLAENEHVLIRTYNIIYELLEDIEDVVEGMLRPGKVEEVLGRANILAEFPYGKVERIAGCRVTGGYVGKGVRVRVLRDGEVVGETKVVNLRKVKEEISKVDKGSECGMLFDPQVDFMVGDTVEAFRVI